MTVLEAKRRSGVVLRDMTWRFTTVRVLSGTTICFHFGVDHPAPEAEAVGIGISFFSC